MKIYLVLCEEKDRHGRKTIFVSHGVDEELNSICLPTEPLNHFGAKMDNGVGMWYIEENVD